MTVTTDSPRIYHTSSRHIHARVESILAALALHQRRVSNMVRAQSTFGRCKDDEDDMQSMHPMHPMHLMHLLCSDGKQEEFSEAQSSRASRAKQLLCISICIPICISICRRGPLFPDWTLYLDIALASLAHMLECRLMLGIAGYCWVLLGIAVICFAK